MTPCDGTSTSERWCCGDSNSCCLSGNDFRVEVVKAIFGDSLTAEPTATPELKENSLQTNSVTSMSTSTSRGFYGPLSTSVTFPGQKPDPVQHDNSPSPRLRIILGATLGGGLTLLLLFVISICICRKRNMKKMNDASTYMGEHSSFYERVT
jgi:hypothetical protein